jgi:hypothetical protein
LPFFQWLTGRSVVRPLISPRFVRAAPGPFGVVSRDTRHESIAYPRPTSAPSSSRDPSDEARVIARSSQRFRIVLHLNRSTFEPCLASVRRFLVALIVVAMSATAHAAGSDGGSSVPQSPSGHLLIARDGGFGYVRFDDTPASHADVPTQQRAQSEFLTPAVHRVPHANRSHNHHRRHHRVAARSAQIRTDLMSQTFHGCLGSEGVPSARTGARGALVLDRGRQVLLTQARPPLASLQPNEGIARTPPPALDHLATSLGPRCTIAIRPSAIFSQKLEGIS